jgi:hypothetical protein
VRLFVVLVRTFVLLKSWVDISFKGEGYDTTSVTVAATLFYGTLTMSIHYS